uniref:ShET2/EspL2 family type III secretion system effector toxin n=1 Tax=Candidatus Ichthyocystis sparus TaxID=1561004 RepID=UPI00114713D8
MEFVSTHTHIAPHLMEIVPLEQKSVPYICRKDVLSSLINLSNKVEVEGKAVSCEHLSLIYAFNGVDCYRSGSKMRISSLFSDEESVERAFLDSIERINEIKIEEDSCERHVIACNRFGNFLHRIASTMILGEQRFFVLRSRNHAMSFRVVHKDKKTEEEPVSRWVVHFFDPSVTNVVSRSEVLSPEEFLDQSRFSLRRFMINRHYECYFRGVESGALEGECAVYEYSDTREPSSSFSTLETLSQDGISGCIVYHVMFGGADPMDIVRLAESSSFSTLDANVRREVFLAKGPLGVPVLHMIMEQNKPSSIVHYNNFLERLSFNEQVNLLPDIIKSQSDDGVPALFVAMQNGYVECIDGFGLLLDRLITVRHRIENFSEVFFDILLAKRGDGLS